MERYSLLRGRGREGGREEDDTCVPTPGSSADTFWGKGFLATALGTASPDRKKTRRGQKNVFDFITWISSASAGGKKRAISTSDAGLYEAVQDQHGRKHQGTNLP